MNWKFEDRCGFVELGMGVGAGYIYLYSLISRRFKKVRYCTLLKNQ